MRAVFVIFDTLNRRDLSCYGGAVHTPNFQRLAERCVTFDNHYVGSLPCMPARRDLQTGRLNFLHRSWGPLEPFDNSFPEILARHGVYSHLATDHPHYWADGGATYHTRYDSFDLIRGQEADPWVGLVEPDEAAWRATYHSRQVNPARRHKLRYDLANRGTRAGYSDFPTVRTIDAGLAFLQANRAAADWFLQVECFDPHEPFEITPDFRARYATDYHGTVYDMPPYGPANDTASEVAEVRANYAATLEHCDCQLGRILDSFDAQGLWNDTALIVSTDHGFLLGEHEFWGKLILPVYDEIAQIPLFLHHPAHAASAGQRCAALTQTIDLMPTFLDLWAVAPPPEVMGRSLLPLMSNPQAVGLHDLREACLFGQFGAAINVTDGRHVYHRYPGDVKNGGNLNQYTLMPTHIKSLFSVEELRGAQLAPPFGFTKGVPVLKVPSDEKSPYYHRQGSGVQIDCVTRLFDLAADPHQAAPLDDPAAETRMTGQLSALMQANDAPAELYARFGLLASAS